MFIDTHCHLSIDDYDDIDLVIKENRNVEISNIIISGCSYDSIVESLEISNKYDDVFVTIGYHPDQVEVVDDEKIEFLKEQLKHPKVVGVGEIGLDYHYGKENRDAQIVLFEKQLKIAEEYNLPVVIHSRDATEDTIECLKKYKEAIRDYKKALEINPKNTKNLNRLASVFILVGNLGEAKMTQQKTLNVEPNNSGYKEQMGTIEKIIEDEQKMKEKINENKFDEAEEICKKLIEKVPAFTDLKKYYIKILIENVKLQEALIFISKEITFEDKMKDSEFDYLTALTLYFD